MPEQTDNNNRGFTANFNTIMRLISLLSVTFVMGFLVLLSIFHGDSKAFVLIFGMLIWYGVLANPVAGIQSVLSSGPIDNNGRNSNCEPIRMGLFDKSYDFPSTTTSMFGMIISYLISPMTSAPWRDENVSVIMGLSVITCMIVYTRLNWGCEKISSLIVGLISGIIAGITWVGIVSNTYPSGLYHGYFSNDAVCAVKAKTFKCKPRKL